MIVAQVAPAAEAVSVDPVNSRAEEQQHKLSALRKALTCEQGQCAAAQLVQGGELRSADELLLEPYLRRWLRARAWDVEAATTSILAHAKWRVDLAPTGCVPKSEVSNELAVGKAFLLGPDTQGRPVMLFQVRKHNAWTRRLEELERFCCYLLDISIASCDPSVNPRGHLSVLLDLSEMGVGSMDIPAVQALFKLLGDHYVERLGQMIMYQPPLIFWGAWNALSPLLPAVTLKKILVLSSKDQQSMVEAVGADTLPKEYGGNAVMVQPLS